MAQDIVEGIKAFKKDKNAVLLDVRTFEEYENQHINGSINIPIQTLIRLLSKRRKKQGGFKEAYGNGVFQR